MEYQRNGLLRDPRAMTHTIRAKISRRGGRSMMRREIPSRGVPIRGDGSLVNPALLASREAVP